jgi:hypothetical protein
VPKFQKHSPNLIGSYILREWNIYMLMPFPNELCYLSGVDHIYLWNYQITDLVKIPYTLLGYSWMETFMAISITSSRVSSKRKIVFEVTFWQYDSTYLRVEWRMNSDLLPGNQR